MSLLWMQNDRTTIVYYTTGLPDPGMGSTFLLLAGFGFS